MDPPPLQGAKGAHVGEFGAQGFGRRRQGLVIPVGKPLLEDAVRLEAQLGRPVEFPGVQQAGSRRLDRRRRIEGDEIVLLLRASQVPPPVVDDDAILRTAQDLPGVVKVVAERRLDAGNKLDARHLDPPGGRRPERSAHADADDERRSRFLFPDGQGNMNHAFGDGSQLGHADAVHQQAFPHLAAVRDDGGRGIAADDPVFEKAGILIAHKKSSRADKKKNDQRGHCRGQDRPGRSEGLGRQGKNDHERSGQKDQRDSHACGRKEQVSGRQRPQDAPRRVDGIGSAGRTRPALGDLINQLGRQVAQGGAEGEDAGQNQLGCDRQAEDGQAGVAGQKRQERKSGQSGHQDGKSADLPKAEVFAVDPRARPGGQEIDGQNPGKGVDRRQQHGRESPSPNDFHRHGSESRHEQDRQDDAGPESAGRCRSRDRGRRLYGRLERLCVSRPIKGIQPKGKSGDREIERRSHSQGSVEAEPLDQDNGGQESAAEGPDDIGRVEKAEARRLGPVDLPDELHHQGNGCSHADAPGQEGNAQHEARLGHIGE